MEYHTSCSERQIPDYFSQARGTSEPNYEAGNGKFGIIVGDPVVSNTTVKLLGSRGYPVQVCCVCLSFELGAKSL